MNQDIEGIRKLTSWLRKYGWDKEASDLEVMSGLVVLSKQPEQGER